MFGFFLHYLNIKMYDSVSFFFASSRHLKIPEVELLGVPQATAMERFVFRGHRKYPCTNNATSLHKKIKLESDERTKEEEEDVTLAEFSHPIPWQKIEAEGLDCDYALLFSKVEADHLFNKLEEEVVYSTGTTSNHSAEVMARCSCSTGEGPWLFVLQGKKQRSWCLERCTIYRESRPHTETQVSHTLILGLHG